VKALKPLHKLILSAFVVGGINGANVWLRDKQDFNLDEGLDALISVFVVAGLTGATTHALNSPLNTKSEENKDDGSTK